MNPAGLSVDVDSVASHLAGYGLPAGGNAAGAYRTAIPRALTLFHRLGVRATFFLIASEAAGYPDVVRRIVREGHEVASHSFTHPLPFPRERGDLLEREVRQSKSALEFLSERPVVGFRAPSWETSPALSEALAEAGYIYNASSYPSPLLFALRWSVAGRGERSADERPGAALKDCFRPTRVHTTGTAFGEVAEVPVCVTPWARLPYYHTMRFMLPGAIHKAIGAWARSRTSTVSYCFHAVDFLAVEQDGLDSRISRHPGMNLPLDRKLKMAEDAITELTRTRDVVTLDEMVQWELPGWEAEAIQSGSPLQEPS